MDNTEINNIQNINNSQNRISKQITMYDITKKRYEDFVKKMEKSDLMNGYTRYLTELSILKQLREYAQQYASEKEIQAVCYQIERINEILKEQFGITVK